MPSKAKAFPEAAKQLGQIRRIVAINLALGLVTIAIGRERPVPGELSVLLSERRFEHDIT
mgnify:CR=1 FL=1